MKIGVELRQIVPGACGGIVPLLQGVLQALFAAPPRHDYHLLCTAANVNLFSSVPPHVHRDVLPDDDYFPCLDRLAAERRLDVLFRSYPLDVPLAFPSRRQVTLIPDMQHEFFPEFFDPETLRKRRASFNRALSEGGAIGTLSEHARRTILDHPAAACRDVFLMPPALWAENAPALPLTDAERAALPLGDFFLFPGNLWPHKNHRRTLQAFRAFRAGTGRQVELLLTGHPAGWEELRSEFPDLPVRHLGFVRRTMLAALMKRTRALVFFSLFEGFGIPLLEAFDAGTPVLCSNTTSLPEVGGAAVLSCDPTDVEAMSDLLRRVTGEEGLRERLAEAGRQRLRLFRWTESTRHLLDACERVAARAPALPTPPLRRQLAAFVETRLPTVARVVRAIRHLQPAERLAALRSRVWRGAVVPLEGLRQRLRQALRPRLGTHHQYPPRPIELPPPFRRRLPQPVPVISLVTPSYNQAEFLERTLHSVLEQNYPRLEYIVQDGGSTDATPAVLQRHRGQLAHCELRPDRGQAHALNLGFRHATGPILAYLNSDDLLLPGALAYVAHYFNAHPNVDVLYGHRVIIDEDDQEVGRWVLPPHDDEVLLWIDYVPQETLFWRRRIWEKVGSALDESFQFALDWDLLLRFRAAGARMVRVPRFLGAFRVHARQKTSARMVDLGRPEIDRLRLRNLGRAVTEEQAQQFAQSYLRRHVWRRLLSRAGVLPY